jgi:hypothetical protein
MTTEIMTMDRCIRGFSRLSHSQKIKFLATLYFELTIVAREAYDLEGPALTHPRLLRSCNEIQHRIAGVMLALLNDDPNRYPDDVFVQVVLSDDPNLPEGFVLRAFTRSLARVAGQQV